MATTQADPTNGVPVPQGGSSSTDAVASPIGVPYYNIDPKTGQPYKDGTQPSRFGVPMPVGPQGSSGTQGPGTQDSSMYDPASRQYYQFPRYYDGAQWLPAQLPPDKIAALQRQMVAAGLLKSGQAQLGVWDAASMNAYTQLLGYANASGLDAPTALVQWSAQHAATPPGAGLPVQVTNDEDLRKVFTQTVINTLGEGWNADKIDHMIAGYHAAEAGAGRAANAASESGGTYQSAPSPQAFAEAQARAQNPLGAQENDIIKPGGPLDAFSSMLSGWLVKG